MSDTQQHEQSSALEAWSAIAQTPELVDYFSGIFHKIGISIEDTGEEFTAIHEGNRIRFEPGIHDDARLHLSLQQENVDNLVAHAHDGRFDPHESWRIVNVLFTPLTRAMLEHPVFARNTLRLLSGVEQLTHVYLINPSGAPPATHTLIYAGGQWLVLRGLHGKPQRTFRLTPDDALEFQRRTFAALREDSLTGWWRYADWYREWRISVSNTNVPVDMAG